MKNKPIIHLEDCSIFQADNMVLQHVNFQLNEGEIAYLIGETGSGKSTLLKLLYGALPLHAGNARVVDFSLNSIKEKNIPDLRRSLGIVFQDFQLLTDRNIFGNLEFVLRATGWKEKGKIKHRIEEVLTDVGLGTKDYKMPFELSGGEQQRVAIARALLNNPKLILADEPTGNLDPGTSDAIIDLLFKLNKEHNTAILIATHDYNIMEKNPARIVRCIEGTISESHDLSAL